MDKPRALSKDEKDFAISRGFIVRYDLSRDEHYLLTQEEFDHIDDQIRDGGMTRHEIELVIELLTKALEHGK